MVNQFLTSLEEYRGFCFCTTNRREKIDMAAMRRFSFKYAFTYATPAQLKALYQTLLAPLGAGRFTEAMDKLTALTHLTPGDFHTVRSKFWLADPGSVQHGELIEALMEEQQLKLEKFNRRIGF
jgi:SpoVK/Ycf46/Vps4 family AAA+-type ATPase